MKMSEHGYDGLLSDVAGLLGSARRASARAVNTILTATYWEIGRRIVEFEQRGEAKAVYGERILERLSRDLSTQFGRGFRRRNLFQIRAFYLAWDPERIWSKLSDRSGIVQTASAQFTVQDLTSAFLLPWSHYVRLLSVENSRAREFYEAEAIHGGWSVRQLDRQIATLFYERTVLSRDNSAMLKKGAPPRSGEVPTAEEEIRDPYVLEFLGLKDEYSESDLEEALIQHLERFLLEMGGDFTFVGRQRRLRIGTEWYRIDLLFFHRKLRCLVVIDLKVGKFTHADAGQMHMYLNYAREQWTHEGENPPVGLILCAEKDSAVARYALEGLPNKVLAAEYKLALPKESDLIAVVRQSARKLKRRSTRL